MIGGVRLRVSALSFASPSLLAAIAHIVLCLPAWCKPLRYAWRHFGLLVLDTSPKLFLHLEYLLRSGKAEFCTALRVGACLLHSATRPHRTISA